MARATRSGKQLETDFAKDKSIEIQTHPSPARAATKGTKKRKRLSATEPDDQPTAKQPRSDVPPAIKEEGGFTPDQVAADTEPMPVDLKGAGDVPMNPDDAQRILDILEMVDTQGLLDRVFPLPADLANLPSSDPQTSQPQTYSFRNLLKEPSRHPLRVLRAAVQPLLPVFAHPRSRPSGPAAEQLKFCNLALSLLDQSSFHTLPSALSLTAIIPERPDAVPSSSVPSSPSPTTPPPATLPTFDTPRKRKHALVQRLPTGDWWTSLSADDIPMVLSTAHAELVAVLPSASASEPPPDVPTLGSYTRKAPGKKLTMPSARHISCGAFLDYGPYASFAPTFDQGGAELGQEALGEVLWMEENKRWADRVLAETRTRRKKALEAKARDVEMEDVEVMDTTEDGKARQQAEDRKKAQDEALASLLPPEEVASIKEALGCLEMEAAVQELLERNSRALVRLEELQLERLGGEGGGTSKPQEGSEEWDVAQGIMDSLSLITSLRPRTSTDTSPLTPSPAILHKLHRTLPSKPTAGWHGTLPATRTTALHDDTTLSLKAGASLPAPVPVPAVTTPAPKAVAPAPAATAPYTGYSSYANYAGGQYRGNYSYTPGAATGSYYPGAYATQQQYGSQQPQSSYNYSSWYQYQQQQQQAPKPGTPQPAQAAGSYAGFFAGQQGPQAQRAVANTVAAKGQYGGASWASAGTGGAFAPTLPPHMRAAAGQQTPGTPTPPGGGGWQYYPAGYQAQQAATPR